MEEFGHLDGLSLFTGLSQLAASSQIEAFNIPVVTRKKRRQNDMTGKEKNRRHSTYINTSSKVNHSASKMQHPYKVNNLIKIISTNAE